ncbi:hypothetical protein BC781_10497 [Sediminitomix flava]|uniref:Uncharacterized protein n=1 Tax=Sediminitomix flava TaxID=379075 RepID=A0A315Z848_SEDFL|nr:hypothetical protein BC781_10497 [Sediminitomix flava]
MIYKVIQINFFMKGIDRGLNNSVVVLLIIQI